MVEDKLPTSFQWCFHSPFKLLALDWVPSTGSAKPIDIMNIAGLFPAPFFSPKTTSLDFGDAFAFFSEPMRICLDGHVGLGAGATVAPLCPDP